jgi:hypothetical protein
MLLTYLDASRFIPLAPMPTLLATLRQRPIASAWRLRLERDGLSLSDDEYLSAPSAEREPGPRLVLVDQVMTVLESGATLFIYECQKAFPPLADLCSSLMAFFRVRVDASLVVATAPHRPTRLHWDGSPVTER